MSMKLFRALKVRKGQLLWYTFLTSQLTNWSGQIMTRRDQWLYPKMWLFHSESTGAGDFVEEDDAQAERVPFDLAFMWWSSKKWWTEWFHAEQLLPPGPLFERIIWHKWLGDNFFSGSNAMTVDHGQSISYWNSGTFQLKSNGFRI